MACMNADSSVLEDVLGVTLACNLRLFDLAARFDTCQSTIPA